MAEETLLTAARRACRFYNIDMNKGGIITVETEQAMATLAKMVEKETNKPIESEPTKLVVVD